MGCGQSAPKDEQDQKVAKDLTSAMAKDRSIKKLLLLGSGGSGKSTIFKQLQTIHGKGFEGRDRKAFRSQIYEQVIESVKIMIGKCEDYYEEDPVANAKYEITNDDTIDAMEHIMGLRNNNDMTAKDAEKLRILWQDPAIQAIWGQRNKICVPDSTSHFLDKVEELARPDYIPGDQDLLLVRYRTTGMAEKDFDIEGTTFKICDVGGQRNERRKWIHFFDGVTAVIFVTALSAYDEAIFEDENANAMKESLEVFTEHINSHWFEQTAFILFLNKNDLFQEKVEKVPISVCFPEFTGSGYEASLDEIRRQFEEKNKDPDGRRVYTHVTCATDTDNIQRVFNDVQHIVINWSLEKSGLL